MPDVFVPVDTSEYSTYYRDLMAKGIINQFAVDYVDRHRNDIKRRYSTVEAFDREFSLTDADMRAFVAMGERDSVPFDETKYRTSENLLRIIIKGIIARDVYSQQGAYNMVVNHHNPDIKTALDIINDPERYRQLLLKGNPDYERLVKSSTPAK